ncbi:MAG: hypothetical protein TU36_006495 [Vulcanisaeta sp. AZ3]|jgi:hypothetical protein|nr:MAG: hypothetical protein TU36_01300 [Vulcanisaeta sp. AZ3]
MAFEIVDLVISILLLILGFSVFTALVNDYKIVVTVSRLIRKRIKVSTFHELSVPLYSSLIGLKILEVKPLNEGIDVEVHGNTIRVINNGVLTNTDIKILITVLIVGRLGDYPVMGMIVLSPY